MRALYAFLFASLFAAGPAFSQSTTVSEGTVVATCGSGVTYTANQRRPFTLDVNGNLCAGVSVSASITGFRPTAYGTPIAVTTGGVTGTLPAGSEVVATNVGTTNGAYCQLGGTATTSSQYIAPNGGWFAFAISGDTQLTCITSTSTTTVNMAGGSGLPTGTGGGGGGGSGGSVTQGTVPWVVSGQGTAGSAATGVVTVQGIASMTKLLVTPDSVALPANQSVNVSQINGVTPLMGNGTTGTGSQRVTIASDNAAFPVNATLQASGSTAIGKVDPNTIATWGLVASTQNSATPTNGALVVGQFNTTPTTITTGNVSPLQMDNAGNLLVNIKAGAGSGGTAIADNAAFTTGTTSETPIGCYAGTPSATANHSTIVACTTGGSVHTTVDNTNANIGNNADAVAASASSVSPVGSFGFLWNGSTWDRMPGSTTGAQVKVASGGIASGAIASGAIAAGAQVDLLTMRGTVAAGTAAANSMLTGAVFNTTAPTLTNGQQAAIQVSARGGALYGSQYPAGSTPVTASATGTTAATTATLATGASITTYLCGFSIRANATAAATANSTVTGTITGTLNFTQWTAPNASGIGITEMIFNPCVPASAVNTGIAVISAAPGTGGVVSSTAWGYTL